jgi:hypothetical protein
MSYNRTTWLDFPNGIYQVNNVNYILTDIIGPIPGFVEAPVVDPTDGLEEFYELNFPFTPNCIQMCIGDLLVEQAAEFAAGFTVVYNFKISDDSFPFSWNNSILGSLLSITCAGTAPATPIPINVSTQSGASILDTGSVLGNHTQIAIVYDPNNASFAISVNGGSITQANFIDPAVALTNATFQGLANALPIVQYATFMATYGVVPLSFLPGLSTLGAIPPAVLGAQLLGPTNNSLPYIKLPGVPPLP